MTMKRILWGLLLVWVSVGNAQQAQFVPDIQGVLETGQTITDQHREEYERSRRVGYSMVKIVSVFPAINALLETLNYCQAVHPELDMSRVVAWEKRNLIPEFYTFFANMQSSLSEDAQLKFKSHKQQVAAILDKAFQVGYDDKVAYCRGVIQSLDNPDVGLDLEHYEYINELKQILKLKVPEDDFGNMHMVYRAPFSAVKAPSPEYGIQMSELEGLYLWVNTVYDAFGDEHERLKLFLLFKDGVALRDPPATPQQLDRKAVLNVYTDRLGRWEKDGNDYYIRMNDGSEYKPKRHSQLLAPFDRGERLDGSWRMESGWSGLGGDVMVFRSRTLVLDEKGRLAYRKMANASGFFGDSGGPDDISFAYGNDVKEAFRGNYELDGYQITIHNDDGTTQREWFGRYSRTNKIVFFRDERLYKK